jgi:predicted TPR repeat methyltransferase
MINRRNFSFEPVLTRATANEIKSLSPYAIDLARRWVKDWPEKARQLEASGKLINALKVHAEDESLHQWRAQIRSLKLGALGSGAPVRADHRSPPAP